MPSILVLSTSEFCGVYIENYWLFFHLMAKLKIIFDRGMMSYAAFICHENAMKMILMIGRDIVEEADDTSMMRQEMK